MCTTCKAHTASCAQMPKRMNCPTATKMKKKAKIQRAKRRTTKLKSEYRMDAGPNEGDDKRDWCVRLHNGFVWSQ